VESTAQLFNRARLLDAYRWLIVATGALALAGSALWLPAPRFDWRFLMLAAVMMLVSSRFSIQIPRVNTNITVSDTFIFVVLLIYGGMAAIFMSALEGLFSGLRISKRPLVVGFNSAMMLASTSLTVLIVRIAFGPVGDLRNLDLSHFIAAVGTMALVQYFVNTGISAVGLACKEGESVWRTWHTHYLWTSITYLAGAAMAALTYDSIDRVGLTVFVVGIPIMVIVYFTYHKYLNEIKTTSALAEQAERERAEAERARAEAER